MNEVVFYSQAKGVHVRTSEHELYGQRMKSDNK